jgi:hypothetical protein
MTRSRNSDQVGDTRTPPLRATEVGLRIGSDQAEKIQADLSSSVSKPSVVQSVAYAVRAIKVEDTPPTTCKQVLWFSFFFDGTGNNRYVDEGMQKHSNVAKLFRAHKPADQAKGIYSFYIQGVGTYFPEIGDDGGGGLGLGCGAMGTGRLHYALKKFDESIEYHVQQAKSPSNEIVEINIAAFGFSRGAALARAFINLLLEERCALRKEKWVLKDGAWPVRIRFMGLFDTVASVGLPMSTNTTSTAGAVASSVSYMIRSRLRDYAATRPATLAFSENAAAGADPAPGIYDGHSDWGNKLEINPKVEEVRHFIAAHEVRNSFPVESVSVLRSNRISKPSHFYETVYPGVHSDIGGSYAPGEGARASLSNENLGLVPLIHMYNYALRQGVPLRPVGAWLAANKADFDVSAQLLETYNHYLKMIGASGSLGQSINKNMGLYFGWRFRAIRIKARGDRKESDWISSQNRKFKEQEAAIDREIDLLKQKEKTAAAELQLLLERRAAEAASISRVPTTQKRTVVGDGDIEKARHKIRQAHDDFLKAKARKDALPNMEGLQEMLDLYDKQLLADVQAIRDVFAKKGVFGGAPDADRRRELRPHYKVLVEAYENEFEKNKGLTDEKIISLFDNHIHDSLAAFAKDATLPSDPRVVYLGGDEKYEYARIESNDGRKYAEVRIA